MRKISYSCSLGQSKIFLGRLEETFLNQAQYASTPLFISSQVASFYPGLIQDRKHYLVLDDGRKDFDQLKEIYRQFLRWQLDRNSLVAICGGGSVLDLIAFAASTFMRGIPFVLIPTTLLSQVDAAIGGKTAVDFDNIKNVIGTFTLPQETFIDPTFLLTLSQSEILDGLAEVVKHALIASPLLFDYLQKNWSRLVNLDLDLIEPLIVDSLKIKIAIVSEDATEKGKRRLLNFGHTLAHALEKEMGYSHGQAVVWGMLLATKFSNKLGILREDEAKIILSFLKKSFSFLSSFKPSISLIERILARLAADKKKEGEMINFVFLKKIGEAVVYPLSFVEIKELFHDLC